MKLISMKLEKKDDDKEYRQGDSMLCCAEPKDGGPAYPWGLVLCLDDDSLKKLGIDKLPDVGEVLTLNALVTVTSNSQRQNQEGKTSSMDLQVTDMALSTGPEKTAAQSLYSGMNP